MRFTRSRRCIATLIPLCCLTWSARGAVRKILPTSIHGAVYLPADAYNAPQLWKNFSAVETERDFGYAEKIHINALRTWASYEFWQKQPDIFQHEVDQMLEIAKAKHIRIMVSLFENDGAPPSEENMWTTDPTKAFAIRSPSRAIASGPSFGWEAPRKFVQWFMQRYGNDDRMLAIEIMNEPRIAKDGGVTTVPFAQSMFTTAKAVQRTVPLTVGSDTIEVAEQFVPLGLDIVQYHVNFPRSVEELVKTTRAALAFGREKGLPVWLTEWQRVRFSASGFGKKKIAPEERGIDYASMAGAIRREPIGSFFWGLMVKRAYLNGQRFNGTVNGLFWPDGSVASLNDAHAIADDSHLVLQESTIPEDFGMEAVQTLSARTPKTLLGSGSR